MDYRTFTINLSRYESNRKALAKAEDDLDLILYDMTGVKGISYNKMPGSYNESLSALKSLEMVEKYNEKLNEVEYYKNAIKSVDIIKQRLPMELWVMLRDKFVYNMTYSAVGIKYGMSANGMWNYLKREVEKYL